MRVIPPAMQALRDDALEVLTAWEPPSPPQTVLRDRYIAHLEAEPGGCWRAGPAVHLTAGVLLLDHARERVLLTLHPKAGKWLQLGGHLEPEDDSLRDAALREATEESGIDGICLSAEPIELHAHELGSRFGHCSEHLDVRYAGRAPAGAEPIRSEESEDLAWWPIDALPEDTDPDLGDLLTAALRSL